MAASKEQVQLVVPTAINMITAINETLITRRKAGLTSDIDLPSLRRRALLVVKEAGIVSLQMTVLSDESDFNR